MIKITKTAQVLCHTTFLWLNNHTLIFMSLGALILMKITLKKNFTQKEKSYLKMKKMSMLFRKVNSLIHKQLKPCTNWHKIILLAEMGLKRIMKKPHNCMENLLHKITKTP